MLRMPWGRRICHSRRSPSGNHYCKQWRLWFASTQKIFEIYSRHTSSRAPRMWAIALNFYYAIHRVSSATSKTCKIATMTCLLWRTWKRFAILLNRFWSVICIDTSFAPPYSFPLGCSVIAPDQKKWRTVSGKWECLRRSWRHCSTVVSRVDNCKTSVWSACCTQT